ncbi:MAG: hypothetical protein M0035_11805 [Actinomycetota bacterium]|nr:hypothetical protein [Actinomycetota bacterium]
MTRRWRTGIPNYVHLAGLRDVGLGLWASSPITSKQPDESLSPPAPTGPPAARIWPEGSQLVTLANCSHLGSKGESEKEKVHVFQRRYAAPAPLYRHPPRG